MVVILIAISVVIIFASGFGCGLLAALMVDYEILKEWEDEESESDV